MEGVLHRGPCFNTLEDVVYLGMIATVAALTTLFMSSSRSLLAAIAPHERISEFCGPYMNSPTATVWMGPMLVKFATEASGDHRVGFAPMIVRLLVGFAVMLIVRRLPQEAVAIRRDPSPAISD